ncbi:MAG: hypothetical protein DRO52_05520 [Candidatus Hecatellales archaeon]|nr:MAG: hypothetical protein DRO52_05520 [Candidatus Hecatellales archaeon]
MMGEDPAEKYFSPKLTARERAVFEAGIALGAIYHQLVGFPVSRKPRLLRLLGEAFSQAFSLQPFRVKTRISISAERLKSQPKASNPYKRYEALKGDQLNVRVETAYGRARVKACLRYLPELGYPLMYVEDLT